MTKDFLAHRKDGVDQICLKNEITCSEEKMHFGPLKLSGIL